MLYERNYLAWVWTVHYCHGNLATPKMAVRAFTATAMDLKVMVVLPLNFCGVLKQSQMNLKNMTYHVSACNNRQKNQNVLI